jgi:SAM-dependent methyltransferase
VKAGIDQGGLSRIEQGLKVNPTLDASPNPVSYRVSAQASTPAPQSLRLVDEVARVIEQYSIGEWRHLFTDYVRNHRIRIALDAEQVKKYAGKQDRVLEVGVVPPVLTIILNRLGYRIRGVDIAPERFSETITGLDVSKCDVETEPLPFPDGSFDLVIFNELFEHLRINPIFTMREVLRILESGGMLLLSTPNLASIAGIRNFLLRNRAYSCLGDIYREYAKLETLGHMGHVREYTAVEVSEFLGKIGFEVDNIIYRGEYRQRLVRIATALFPRLRPYFTVVARKPCR